MNRTDIINMLSEYADTPDDDNIRFKDIIKRTLLDCPQLLFILDNPSKLDSELFDENDNLNKDGAWDMFFSDASGEGIIRPYIFTPDSQVQNAPYNYLCYQVHFDEAPRFNTTEKYALITFTIFVRGITENIIEPNTGLPRHDLVSAIIRDRINWSNIFGTQCKLVSSKEGVTDNNYIFRTMIFRVTNVNSIVKTVNGKKNIYDPEDDSKVIGTEDAKKTLMINKLGRM